MSCPIRISVHEPANDHTPRLASAAATGWRRWLTRLAIAAALCGAVSVCLPSSGPATARPTLEQLRGATIRGIEREPIILKEGVYEGSPVRPGGASRLRVTLWGDLVAFGGLSGMPGEASAVLLSASAGGSGSVVYLAVFRTRGGALVNAGTAVVGDRSRVRGLRIIDRTVAVDVVEPGSAYAMCCPSQLVRKSYAFREGTLTLVSSAATGILSLAALAGTDWTLVSLAGQPVPAGAQPPTIVFDSGRVSGFGGCNHYTGQVEERTPGTIAIDRLAATKMACPSPAMEVEDRYFATLATVSQYTFVASRLLLSGADGSTSQQLTFERARP